MLVFVYFSFYKGYFGLVSVILMFLLGEKVMCGFLGGVIDVLVVIVIVIGVVVILGFGVL